MADDPHFRRSSRTPVGLRARYRKDEPGSALEKAGRVSDLGMGGAFVETNDPPAVGVKVCLIFGTPTAWDPLELPAEVRWVKHDRPSGFGVRFRALTPAQASALTELVRNNPFQGLNKRAGAE
jgi:Tfp pilus assembly protein PilZ